MHDQESISSSEVDYHVHARARVPSDCLPASRRDERALMSAGNMATGSVPLIRGGEFGPVTGQCGGRHMSTRLVKPLPNLQWYSDYNHYRQNSDGGRRDVKT